MVLLVNGADQTQEGACGARGQEGRFRWQDDGDWGFLMPHVPRALLPVSHGGTRNVQKP